MLPGQLQQCLPVEAAVDEISDRLSVRLGSRTVQNELKFPGVAAQSQRSVLAFSDCDSIGARIQGSKRTELARNVR